MTIFVTPFDPKTRQCQSVSTDSGFNSLEQVVEMMGEPIKQTEAFLIYGDDSARVLFSRVAFYKGPLDVEF